LAIASAGFCTNPILISAARRQGAGESFRRAAGAEGRTSSDSRCFELRTYTVRAEGPGSIDLLHDRFRQHTNRLFRKHGMTIVGFWQPVNTGMERTLIYILAYKDGAAGSAGRRRTSR
jgi:hypothetical protein